MFKKITLFIVALVIFGLIFPSLSIVQAKENINFDSINQPLSIDNKTKNEELKNRKTTKLKSSEFKIVNGEIDTQFNVKISKEEESNFNKCKLEEKLERKPRYKNRPTACLKKTTQVNDHITDQDYNLLWQSVNQQIEENAGVDMQTELPISEFIEANTISNSSNSFILNISSLNSSSSANDISSNSEKLLSSLYSAKSESSTNSKKIGFLDIIFGSVKADAAVDDGWRLPYPKGQRPTLTQGPKSPYSHNLYTAFDFDTAGVLDEQIVNAKAGTVIFKGTRKDVNGVVIGFGNHVLVQSADGSTALYAHLKSFDVNTNDSIARGSKIGIQGSTGNSSAPHLHFETWSSPPCGNSNMPESCWLSQSYLNARMFPQFDECYQARGGLINTYPDCTNGYPNTAGKWYESINSVSSTPASIQAWMFKRTGTNQCLNSFNSANYSKLDTYVCNQNDGDQLWTNNGGGFRKRGSSFCMNSNTPSNAKGIIMWSCNSNDNDQNWNWSPNAFVRNGTNQCMDVLNPVNNKQVYTYLCDSNNGNQKWEAIWLP